MSTYLYAVVRREHPRELGERSGIGSPGARLREVEIDGLIAIVSDAPENVRAKRRDLLAHEDVLETLCAQGATLPMRFGIVATDDDSVSAQLACRAEHYRQLLTELDGRTEVNIKARHHEDAVLRQVLLENTELRRFNDQLQLAGGGSQQQRMEFGEKVSTAVQDRERQDATNIANLLRGHVIAERDGPAVDGCFLNVSFLLGKPDVSAFQATVDEMRDSLDWLLELRVNGPLPPYSFADTEPN